MPKLSVELSDSANKERQKTIRRTSNEFHFERNTRKLNVSAFCRSLSKLSGNVSDDVLLKKVEKVTTDLNITLLFLLLLST